MKNILLTVVLLVILINQSSGQFWKPSETVTIYDFVLKAKDICGHKKFVGFGKGSYPTNLLSLDENASNYLSDLGTYRSNFASGVMESLPLFNLSDDGNYFPLLDTIDFDYYQSKGLSLLLSRNPSLQNDSNFARLTDVISNKKFVTKEKKDFLFLPQYRYIRDQLIISRFDTIITPFTIDKKKVNISTIQLKASLDTIILNNTIGAKAELLAYVHNLADEHVKVFGNYYQVKLHQDYVGKIKYYIESLPSIPVKGDQFVFYLSQYLPSEKAAANTELVAVQLKGTYDKTKINSDSIATVLSGQFHLSADTAYKIAVKISMAFSHNETTTVSTNFNKVVILRYWTSEAIDKLESVKGATMSKIL